MPESDEFECYDEYISSEVISHQDGEHMLSAKVISRAKYDMGNAIGVKNANPTLDMRVYGFICLYGYLQQYVEIVMDDNMYPQVYAEGHFYHFMDDIIYHRTDGQAVQGDDDFSSRSGRNNHRFTTKGWFLCVMWKDVSDYWIALKVGGSLRLDTYPNPA